MALTIVVLGGSFAGLQVAHRLLKHTRNTHKDLKVILVSKDSHFFWNLASVRAVVPGVLKEEQYNLPIEPGFAKYPAESFEFIVGSAEAADLDAKTVRVVTATGERSLSYDHLVLGTGTRYMDPNSPWKANGTNEEVMASVKSTQEKIRAAKHIVVAGAGATGVETAGEIRFEFKDKEVVLLSGGDQILGGDAIAGNAEQELIKLGVQVKLGARVTGSHELPDEGAQGGKTEVTLANGETILTDLYLPTMGVLPNTEYLPAKVLRDDKYVLVDEFGRVQNAENVWAAGDIISEPKSSFIIADKQAAGVAKNIDLVLNGKKTTPVKLIPVDVFVCAVGRSRGAGRMAGIKVFSFMVYMIKGKTLGTQMMPGIVDGSSF
ncbi:uncharacterized protein PG998_003691 [Apiospora kogelbergensis]|uniref:FAD/NAD(P)-binding domain-containing protein n=1 Tax=Apiospora kogelbergensis TaxID=1337665 RepID=A0AAW0QMV4_9PEZI